MSKSAFQQFPTTQSGSGIIGFTYYSTTDPITISGTSDPSLYYSYHDTGIELTVTPHFASSTILIRGQICTNAASNAAYDGAFRLYRVSPGLAGPISIGENGTQANIGMGTYFTGQSDSVSYAMMAIDLAETINEITYKLQVAYEPNTSYINRGSDATRFKGITQFVLMEVANIGGDV